jgi:hypothetical protein
MQFPGEVILAENSLDTGTRYCLIFEIGDRRQGKIWKKWRKNIMKTTAMIAGKHDKGCTN